MTFATRLQARDDAIHPNFSHQRQSGNAAHTGGIRGGEAAAVLYTLIETAKGNGHNPRLWLTRVLETIGRDRGLANYDALLPWTMSPEPPSVPMTVRHQPP
ncbi:transposase domain-containing protein [Azospirillum doebereinerae]